MKPQPMSDAEIEAAAKRLAECMDYPWEFMPEKGRENMRQHARAIVGPAAAARDAQWVAMLGEPAAGRSRFAGERWTPCSATHVRMVKASQKSEWPNYEAQYLYAPKEAP